MKHLFIVTLATLISLSACTFDKTPEFIKITDINILEATATDFIIETTATFRNPNDLSGTLQAKDVKVYIDEIHVADVVSEDFNVPKKAEFSVPLVSSIAYDKVFQKNKGNLLGDIINIINNKKVTVTYKGNIRYKLGSFYYDYPLNYSEDISLIKK